jgi:hypothetical protein
MFLFIRFRQGIVPTLELGPDGRPDVVLHGAAINLSDFRGAHPQIIPRRPSPVDAAMLEVVGSI